MKYCENFNIPSAISNPNLLKILNFYLLSCPVEGISHRGKTFKDYGFRGQPSFRKLRDAMMEKASASLKGNYKPCKQTELEDAFRQMENVSPPDEYCVFLKHDEKTVMRSLFSAIRNAFAHGSFNVKAYKKVRIYFFANEYKGKARAKIVLQEKTLLAWIKLVESGYSNLLKS